MLCVPPLAPPPSSTVKEKCKNYRPQSMQQQRDPPLGRSRQVDATECDVAKRRKSKLFSSFKSSFTR